MTTEIRLTGTVYPCPMRKPNPCTLPRPRAKTTMGRLMAKTAGMEKSIAGKSKVGRPQVMASGVAWPPIRTLIAPKSTANPTGGTLGFPMRRPSR